MRIGRQDLYTSEKTITYQNVIDVLRKVLPLHEENVSEIEFLDNYEKGFQPLARKKNISSRYKYSNLRQCSKRNF